MKKSVYAILLIFSGVLAAYCSEPALDIKDITISPKAYGAIEVGQIVQGHYKQGGLNPNQTIANIWQERALANVGFAAKYREHLEIEIIGEGMMAFSTPQVGTEPTTLQPRQFFYIKSSNAKINLGNPSALAGEVQVGYFPYKYNRDVRNLGEYLFRSSPYPLVLYTDFDYPMANLLGVRGQVQGLNKLIALDLLLHSELTSLPTQNWSLSGILSSDLFKIADLGIGGSLYHFLNVYQGTYMPTTVETYYYPENLQSDKAIYVSDTAMGNHQTIKLMGRAAVDLKQVISKIFNDGAPLPLFNRNDLRLYGEIDVIGTNKYEPYFNDLSNQVLYTWGFNAPGLMVFDYINFEFEYCNNPNEFSDEKLFGDQRPQWEPPRKWVDENGDSVSRAPVAWSIYCKKSFFNDHLSLIAQLARDHKRINFYYFRKEFMSFRETLPAKDDWWWTFKTEFKF
jgi:hypothetical protein